jgi:hypothetical protein
MAESQAEGKGSEGVEGIETVFVAKNFCRKDDGKGPVE